MRKLKKVPESHSAREWLALRQAEFRARFDAGNHTETDLARYRNKIVKEAVASETATKCAYCEAKYGGVAWGDVEHILPKSKDIRNRTLDYSNLTVVCSVCNVNKADHECPPLVVPLIHPYDEDPAKFLRFCGPLAMPSFTPQMAFVRGELMIEIIDLNRTGLIEKRQALLKTCHNAVREYSRASEPGIKRYARKEIDKLRSETSEFSMCAHYFFKASEIGF